MTAKCCISVIQRVVRHFIFSVCVHEKDRRGKGEKEKSTFHFQ